MINLDELKSSVLVAEVNPSNNLFDELGRNTYDYKDLLSELIDNSVAARDEDTPLEITIDIYVDGSYNASEIVIKDNASGIPIDIFGSAISPAGRQSVNSLNEHGLGMKQAVAALGKLNYLATKTADEPQARVIREFRFGEIPIFYSDFDQDSGTEISIIDVKPIVVTNPGNITRDIIPILGARYRRFLRSDENALNLKINLRDESHRATVKYSKALTEVKPTYFHPSHRTNAPVILKHKLKGTNWSAELTFGYAPSSEEEYDELDLPVPSKFAPYKVTQAKQGLDVIYRNRVILFHQLSEIGIVSVRHPNYNNVRGELDLKEGFSTAITKNSIISDKNFVECIEKVRRIVNGEEAGPNNKTKDYLDSKRFPEELPESLLRDRLMDWLANNSIQQRKDIKKEFVVEGIEGYIDIRADDEVWEIKTRQSSAYDVYQLFMYMDVGKMEIGFLVAESFSTGAQVAAQHIKSSHNKSITLAPLSDFPINHQPSVAERAKYLK